MKITNIILVVCVLLANLGTILAKDIVDLPGFARRVFGGGKVFSREEIDDVTRNENLAPHHRVILQVQMLAGTDDVVRYGQAIDLASEYIASGEVKWAKDYLRMQRGFLFSLSGDREAGNAELEQLVTGNAFEGIDTIRDPILDEMRRKEKSLAVYFGDVMKQSIGHYYLDFRKQGRDEEKARQYFEMIESDELREKCLQQVWIRVGKTNEIRELSVSKDETAGRANDMEFEEGRTDQAMRKEEQQAFEMRNGAERKSSARRGHGWVFGAGVVLVIVCGVIIMYARVRNRS